MARIAAIVPWSSARREGDHLRAVDLLAGLWMLDAGIGETVARFPWVQDGINVNEDAVNLDETLALDSIVSIAERDIPTARAVVAIGWLSDGLTSDEEARLLSIRWAIESGSDVDGLVQSIYSRDDPDTNGSLLPGRTTNDSLLQVSLTDEALASAFLEHDDQWGDVLGEHIAWRLARLTESGALGHFSSQSWFTDGLSATEIVFMALFYANTTDTPVPEIPAVPGFVWRRTVSLPLTGEVRIWAFHEKGRANAALTALLADSISVVEDFVKAPLPTSDIVVLVANDTSSGVAGLHWGSHFTVNVLQDHEETIPHEVGHYYFSGGPTWFTEGAAELMRAYVHDARRVESLAARSSSLSSQLSRKCFGIIPAEIENIWHYQFVKEHRRSTLALPTRCVYALGENFLLAVRSLIGDEALSSALSELYVSSEESEAFSEEKIYELLLKHTPPEKQASFTEIYDRLHGGPFSDPSRAYADDHSDLWTSATPITVGEQASGTFDYAADLDFFKFEAEEGKRYSVVLHHGSVGASGISLFNVADNALSSLDSNISSAFSLDSTGPQVLLLAPTAGDYYFSIQNFNGATGDYRVQVSGADIPSDSGNTPSTADEVAVGTTVRGAIDDAVDADYYRFPANQGQRYRIEVAYYTTMPMRVFRLDDRGNRTNTSVIYGTDTWTAPVEGAYYLQLHPGYVTAPPQPYTLSVTLE